MVRGKTGKAGLDFPFMSTDSPNGQPGGSIPAASAGLGVAPAAFLGPAWAKLSAVAGGAEAARRAIDEREPGIIAFYRREALARGGPAELILKARRQDETRRLAEALIEDFRRLCAVGALKTSGIFENTGLRQPIPAEFWPRATIEFASGRVASGALAWLAVTVEAADPPAARDAEGDIVRTWLQKRRDKRGDEVKKALEAAAQNELSQKFTVRRFNAAYSALYGQRRGRPEINK